MDFYLLARHVSNMERSLAFYVGVLGFERTHEVRDPRGRHVVYVGPASRAWSFQLVADGSPVVVDAADFVGFECEDVDSELEALKSRGAVLDGPHVLPGGARYAFVADPDGHRFRVIQKTGFLKKGVHGAR